MRECRSLLCPGLRGETFRTRIVSVVRRAASAPSRGRALPGRELGGEEAGAEEQERDAEGDAVDGKDGEAVAADVAEEPADDAEGDQEGDGQADEQDDVAVGVDMERGDGLAGGGGLGE